MTNPESRAESQSARRAQIDGSSTPLTRRQMRELQLEREARAAHEAEPRALSRRERIAAEAAARAVGDRATDGAVAGVDAPDAAALTAEVVDVVPTVTTEIVIVPVAEPAPLTRRQLRDREQSAREREAALRAEELADLEIATLDSGALEPAVELALEAVDDEPRTAGISSVEPPLHLAPTRRRDRDRSRERAESAPASAVEAPLVPAESLAGPISSTAQAAPAAVAQPARPAEEARPVVPASRAAGEAQLEAMTARPADILVPRLPAPADDSVAPYLARASSLALAAPGVTTDPAVMGGRSQAGPVASVSRRSARRALPAPSATVGRAGRRGGWAKAGLTAVAMSFVLGITAVTAIPSTVSASPVDANVVNLSLNAGTAPASQQLITAGSASEVVDRDGYAVTDAGELQAAGYSTAQLLVGRSLAQELVNAVDSGKLVGSTPDHIKEIRWIAQGVTVPDCGVDYRVLEIIAIAVRNFDQVGVSDINRKCTGQIEGAGTSSSHYVDGGGHAVDFYLLDNKSLNGTDAGTLKLISLLDPVMPVGAHVGQAECRASAGIKLQLTNWTEFDDSCTHMHVDVPVTDAPLLLTDDSLLAAQ